ncbi:MAG: monovalent cation/H+ antiporter subunit D [Rhodanobacteraceae bacterium]
MSGALAIAPILIPLAVAAVQLLLGIRFRRLRTSLSFLSCFALVAIAAALMVSASAPDGEGTTLVYNLGNWPATFAIVLVVDRLSALMLLLTAVLALAVLPYALGRWQRMGPHFQPLVQLLLVGYNGAFLTGDLFNLFVFFEVLLAASYGLALHGSGARRVGAGLHYIAINLIASMLFLIGVGLIFGVTGTLNMAVLAHLIPGLTGTPRALLHAGAALLGLAFLIKAAVWPVGFWLPRTYSAAIPPVAALFSGMTKLGIYVILRLSLLLFGVDAGAASAHFGSEWLLWLGIITLVVGSIGMLGARELAKLASYCVLVSSGTLLGAIALHSPAVTAGALAYLVISVLGIAAFFLLAGLVVPRDASGGATQLEPYDPAIDALFAAEDERRVTSPAPVVILAACFLACGLLLAGLPPLSGFLAKFALLAPMLGYGIGATLLFALTIVAGLCTVIAMARAGIQIFWADADWEFPRVEAGETISVVGLLGICLVLTFVVAAPWNYLSATAREIHAPEHYIHAVMGEATEIQP